LPFLVFPLVVGFRHAAIDEDDPKRERKFARQAITLQRQQQSAYFLATFLAIWPIVYIVAMSGMASVPVTIAVYQLGSVFTKCVFSTFAMDMHLEALVQVEQNFLQEERANEARKTFMKYIFHEVQNPLNSITCGIRLLLESPDISSEDKKSLVMMNSASEFMRETLDNVLNMQRVEEGKLDLNIAAFSLKQVIEKVTNQFNDMVSNEQFKPKLK
jgi:signal transduction histidine kinase